MLERFASLARQLLQGFTRLELEGDSAGALRGPARGRRGAFCGGRKRGAMALCPAPGGRLLLRALALRGSGLGARRAASTGGQRSFFQRINEQYLAHELERLSVPGHSESAAGTVLFDPKVRLRPTRRLVPTGSDGRAAEDRASGEAAGASSEAAPGFMASRRRKPWLHYESLRGDTYPSGSASEDQPGPRWQDLTHSEAQRLQEMYMRKRMLDRKVHWMKMQELPNAEKDAKMTLRRQKRLEEEQKAEAGDSPPMYPPPFLDEHPGSRWLTNLEEKARRDELESRFRTRIREQKLENARIVKAAAPKVGDLITDPIQRHVQRRLVRQRAKIHAGLEELLTRNDAQILCEFLKGVAVSIVKVRAKRPRATQQIHYSLSSHHDPEWVQKQLDILAPKLRSQFAVKVNMGQTPNIRFVPVVRGQDIRRKYLWGFSRRLQQAIPPGGRLGPQSLLQSRGRGRSHGIEAAKSLPA